MWDACEDLAQTFFQRQDYDYTELWLQRARNTFPISTKWKKGVGIPEIPVAECGEEYWQLMGKSITARHTWRTSLAWATAGSL